MSFSYDEGSDVDLEKTTYVKRKTHAGPWRCKKEFDQVYDWVYGQTANLQTKEKACKQIRIWKLRRSNLTSGTILSTLLILEAELKDADYASKGHSEDSSSVYANAFTRFLNYMSAISQSQNMKTMYAAARELKIDPFIVDLRHLCAHGHIMPTLDVFRRTCAYCLNWLRDFYWDVQKEAMTDVDAKSVRRKDITSFDESIREMFSIYDSITEVLSQGCTHVSGAKKHLSTEKYALFKNYSVMESEQNLEALVESLLKKINKRVKQGARMKALTQTFIDAFLDMTYFFEEGGECDSSTKTKSLISRHQGLFKTIASNGLMEDLYSTLIEMADNEFENIVRRKGAAFWAKQIVIGSIAFKRAKMFQKKQKEGNVSATISLDSINVKYIAKNLLETYRKLGFDAKSVLMIGDSTRCPWTLSFNRDYVMKRMECINEFTADIIKSCLELVSPPLDNEESASLKHLIDVFVDKQNDMDSNQLSRVYTLQEDVLKNDSEDVDMIEDLSNQKTFGIWTKVEDGLEWHTCPLGRLMWE